MLPGPPPPAAPDELLDAKDTGRLELAPKPPEEIAPRRAPTGDPFVDVVAVGTARRWKCSGIAVSRRHVLTARHCLPAMRVLVGTTVWDAAEIARVVDSAANPDGFDAAILTLDRNLSVTIRPRRAIRDGSPPTDVTVAGYGSTEAEGRPGHGERRFVPLRLAGWGCDSGRAETLGCRTDAEMAVPSLWGRDTCDGDSGGPMLEWVAATRTWRLVGITSRAFANARVRCGDGGIYVRADKLSGWIDDVVSRKKEPE